MRLVVVSHKPCWRSDSSPSGFETDGGFPLQMRALSELADETVIVVPEVRATERRGVALRGKSLRVAALRSPWGAGVLRKLLLPLWFALASPAIVREIRRADLVHTPIPGDVGTVGIVVAELLRKPLLVRHCGNWHAPRTRAERLWRWYMERLAGGRRVMLATGQSTIPPSRNPSIHWIFSTALDEADIEGRGRDRVIDPSRPLRLAIACRQVQLKGTGLVIAALPAIIEAVGPVHLDVIGDGPDLQTFRSQADELSVQDACTFHGQIPHDQVLDILEDADLFVFPTQASEGFPKVVGEALALGLPVITTAVSTLPDLMDRGCGLLVEPTPEGVVTAVVCVATDGDLYAETSRTARKVASAFTLSSWQAELEGHLARLPAIGPGLRSGSGSP